MDKFSQDRKLKSIQEIGTYHIDVQGRLEEDELNAISPLEMTMERAEPSATRFTIRTDQSGLIGLIRHLHGRGFVLLSIYYER